MSHTYAMVLVSSDTYEELKEILLQAGYAEQIHQQDGKERLDMHGLALSRCQEPPEMPVDYHPAVQEVLRFFSYAHLPQHLQEVSKACCVLAEQMARTFPQSRETTVGLRRLLEAKDCFVRAAL